MRQRITLLLVLAAVASIATGAISMSWWSQKYATGEMSYGLLGMKVCGGGKGGQHCERQLYKESDREAQDPIWVWTGRGAFAAGILAALSLLALALNFRGWVRKLKKSGLTSAALCAIATGAGAFFLFKKPVQLQNVPQSYAALGFLVGGGLGMLAGLLAAVGAGADDEDDAVAPVAYVATDSAPAPRSGRPPGLAPNCPQCRGPSIWLEDELAFRCPGCGVNA